VEEQVIAVAATRPVRKLGVILSATAAMVMTGSLSAVLGAAPPAGVLTWRANMVQRLAAGGQLWVSRYDGTASMSDNAFSVAASPDGSSVFVTGFSPGVGSGADDATVAYAATDGAQKWVRRYNGPANGNDWGCCVAVSPDAARVFVTGPSAGSHSADDYATIAYDAATGQQLWVRRYNGRAGSNDRPASLAVSPDGSKVFVTGTSVGRTSGTDYATVAYTATTGSQLWVNRYNGPADRNEHASRIAVSPGGRFVFVTGYSRGGRSIDYATVAYAAATGKPRWIRRYDGPANADDFAHSVAVGADGHVVYVTGASRGTRTGADYATVAYSASTGAQRWVRRYNGPAGGDDSAAALAVGPATIYVTGTSPGVATGRDFATVAYDAATGARKWVNRYTGPGDRDDDAFAIALSEKAGDVVVTGRSDGGPSSLDFATVAYDASTGAQRWASRDFTDGDFTDSPFSLAIDPSGNAVFVTGYREFVGPQFDYATVAYQN